LTNYIEVETEKPSTVTIKNLKSNLLVIEQILTDARIPEIVKFRASLVNSRFPAYVKDRNNKMLEISKEVGMASKPVDIEINLEKAPSFRWSFDLETAPLGPAGKLKHASITSNPFVSRSVEKAVEDTDWKANEALVYLHKKGFDENFLMRLFSVGNLGIQEKRKLVPTRWSITATDDILGKDAINRVKNYSNYVNYSAFFGSYLGNYYLILLFPEPWSYELFETYTPSQRWTVQPTKYSTDYENTSGRKNYAEQTAGGYYTTRLIAAEYMDSVRKQGACLAIRLITDEYAVPLGVWVTREASRKAMNKDPIEFSSKELMLKYAYEKIKKQFGYDATNIINNSLLLKELKEQRRLGSYF